MSKKRRQHESNPRKEHHPDQSFRQKSYDVIEILNQGTISIEAIIKGIKPFLKYFLRFLKKPLTFFYDIQFSDKYIFRNSFLFFAYGMSLYYLILLPALIFTGGSIDRFALYIQLTLQEAIRITVTHLALRVFGGHGKITQTFSAYFFSIGFIVPIFTVFALPVYFKLGPDLLVYPGVKNVIDYITHMPASDKPWVYYYTLVKYIFSFVQLIHLFVFSKVIHHISWFRIALAYVLKSIIYFVLLFYIILPFFEYISPLLKRLSELIF